MYVNETRKYLKRMLKSPGAPAVMLWGAPGIGKSQIISQIAAENSWDVYDIRLLLLNPIDLRGIPVPDKDRRMAVWLQPEFLPTDEDGEGIVFLDEINAAVPSVQASAYQLVLDRRVGEYRLPSGYRVVCAGNRINDRGVVYSMPSPLANRMLHIDMECSVDDWKQWAMGRIHPLIISFLEFKPDLLFSFPSVNQEVKAFPSPRSWEFVSRMMKVAKSDEELAIIISSAVGEAAAGEFISYIKIYKDLPSVEDVLEGKVKAKVPEQPDIIYSYISALVYGLRRNQSDKRVKNMIEFVKQLPIEHQVTGMKQIYGVCGDKISKTPEFREWAQKNKEVVL